MSQGRILGRIVLRAAVFLATPVAIACSNSSNGAAVEGGDADTAESGRDGSIGSIKELNAEAAVTNGAMCGGAMCIPPTGGLLTLSACCLPNDECGASLGAALTGIGDGGSSCISTAAGNPDPSCPAQTIMGMSVPACCSAEGVCGVSLAVLGLGCNSPSVLGALAPGVTEAVQPCGDAAGGPVPDAAAE